jgi:hypothetical protein
MIPDIARPPNTFLARIFPIISVKTEFFFILVCYEVRLLQFIIGDLFSIVNTL